MNTIFRPNNFFATLSDDNLLEINLTVETLQFMDSDVLKTIANRGFDNQEDIFMTGTPYQQTVSNRLDEKTGLADPGKKAGIHFEQGLLLLVPKSNSPDTLGLPTICRMASIPHGTTLNAQDFEPKSSVDKPPQIPVANFSPFFPTSNTPAKPFNNMKKATKVNPVVEATGTEKGPKKVRIPDEIKGSLSLANINDPNLILRDINKTKPITKHFEFTVSTKHSTLPGGGVANIAFLMAGTKPENPISGNANATKVTCTYWISTLAHKLDIPADDYSTKNFIGKPTDDVEGVPGPQFEVVIGKKTNQKNTITVESTQIQYSQNVTLDFGKLSWPHISVATLAPALPILIKNDPILKDLK
jgi:hypothetical protein